MLAAGADGVASFAKLPEPVDVDPAALGEDELAARGIARLPSTLRESLDAFLADDVLRTTFGRPLVGAITAVRESEIALFDGISPEDVAAATRWAH